MPVSSVSGSQVAGSALWSQVQQQQAQRNADQAEQRARALQAQANEAQSTADRAQENARSLQVESNAAQSDAGEAKRNLVAMKSIGSVQSKFSDIRQQISNVLQSDTLSGSTAALVPVVNAFGEETGTVVNVTA
jgi:type II secretory pathway pseudopilin PulG